jgi:hypothetical protein
MNEFELMDLFREHGDYAVAARETGRADEIIEALENLRDSHLTVIDMNPGPLSPTKQKYIDFYRDEAENLKRIIWSVKETKFLTPDGKYKGNMGATI